MLTEEVSRMSRGHIRFFASVERAGTWFKIFMSVFPILVNFAWVGIYFVERDNDVFRSGGACSYENRSQLFDGPSPFFITTRSILMWQTQTLFAMLNAFLWAPFRYMRTGLTTGNFVFLMVIELLTVFPFLFSLVFFPAYVAYVPTYLRGFIMKHEILFVMSKEGVKDRGNRLFLIWSLMLDLFSTMITVIGILEWAQNNFPRQNYDALWGEPDLPIYGCYSFFVCIYWFIVTISTAGYGDIVPLNNVARLVIVCSIAFFLLFLPEFINRVTTIMRLSANLKQVEFAQQKKRNFVIVDGTFPLPIAQQALALFQPKFNLGEFAIKNLVLILPEEDDEANGGSADEEEFTRLTTDQAGLFCELFLMQGRVLQSDEGLQRSQARVAKTIYILPRHGVKTYVRTTQAMQIKRESMAESREFCLRRDFDQIKRIGGLKNRLGQEQIPRTRTVLFHESNKKLVEVSSSSSCCDPMNVLCLDSFGQRIAASTVLVPAFNTLWALLMLSGSVTDKTFSEYDAEADGERFTHEHYLAPVSHQNSVRVVDEDEDMCFERNDDIEFVLGLHHTLLLAEFTGRNGTRLRDICLHALQQRVLVLGCARREAVCGVHFDFRAHLPVTMQWDHSTAVRTRDYLVCFGDAQEISQLNDPTSQFWSDMNDIEDNEDEGALLQTETLSRRHIPREGDSSVSQQRQQQQHCLKDQHLADARARSEIDEINITENAGVYLPVEPTSGLPARLENHVIVYTASHVSFMYFVKKLRSSGVLHNSMPILLMDPKPPSLFHWSEVGAFDNVFFLQGSPFILNDLLRAGFEHANTLVLLVDYRARYQTVGSSNNNLDEENLLGERVACKLKQMLQCKTRIITHLVKEEHFEYIEGNQTKLAGLEQQPRLKSFVTLFQSVWSPIQSQSYIAGECFFPSIFQPLFFVSETRGNWLQAFLNELCEIAGRTKHGLVLKQVEVAEEGETYAQLAVNLLREPGGGLAIGLFRNYVAPAANASFRGVLLFPSNELVVTNQDRVYVLG